MNCTDFKIWLESATDEEINSVSSEVQAHVDSCMVCKVALTNIQNAYGYMYKQKQFDLTEIQSAEIVNKLCERQYFKKSARNAGMFIFSKMAVAAIIIFGVLLGVLAGAIITSSAGNNQNAWSNEFTLLSDNTDLNTLVFE